MSWKRNLQGFELGAATMGVFITFGSILAWMVIGGVAGFSVVVLLSVAAVLAVALPILSYPITYTVWFGVDLAMHAPDATDLEQAKVRLLELPSK